jgi:hypothetical protein
MHIKNIPIEFPDGFQGQKGNEPIEVTKGLDLMDIYLIHQDINLRVFSGNRKS